MIKDDVKQIKAKIVQSRSIPIDELTFENLTGNELKVYMSIRFEADFSKRYCEVNLSIDFIVKKSKVSRSKVFEALNKLEFTHFLLQRLNYKNFKRGQTNSFLVSRDYNYFKQSDQLNITHPENDMGVQYKNTHPESGLISPENDILRSQEYNQEINKNDCAIFDSSSNGEEYPDTYYSIPKEVQNEKLINEILQSNPCKIPEELIRAWIECRKAKNTPVTFSAWSLMCKILYKYLENQLDPIEAFELMVANGWSTLNIKKSLEYNQKAKYKPKSKAQLPVYDHNDTSWINDIDKDMF